jgi:glycosyltransferase involved in cell wall biosynthesis
MVGFRRDPTPELRAADVVVISSRYDGMALILLEAMACGAAIVATQVSGSSALDGVGELVPTEDPRALAEALGASSPASRPAPKIRLLEDMDTTEGVG